MRVRAALLIPLTCGALIAFAGAASALQIGPVNVPLTVPPVPALTPAVGTNPIDLPDANVDVTPNDGATVGVTLPGSVGPVTVAPDPPAVQVTVDPSGVAVTTTPDGSGSAPATGDDSTPVTVAAGSDASTDPAASDPATAGAVDAPPTASDPAASPAASSPVSGLPASPHAAVANAGTAAQASARSTTDPSVIAAAAVPVGPETRGTRASTGSASDGTIVLGAPKEVAVPDAVNAVLQHAAPGGSWSLAREAVTVRFGLWLALLAILGVVRWSLAGLVRDARRRAGFVSSV